MVTVWVFFFFLNSQHHGDFVIDNISSKEQCEQLQKETVQKFSDAAMGRATSFCTKVEKIVK